MADISKNYESQIRDEYWYNHWLKNGYFESKPDDREPYTIVIPPPNVTGILHMGHCLNNTIQDILIRYARQQGKNACWVPGTDHASIATEAKVVQMLRERGITKSSLGRDEFLTHAWEWKEKYGGIILQQLKKLGCSLDWSRVTFTMDPDYYQAVIGVFIDLYKKGLIYRGKRMINWDPAAKTALSDEEVVFKETNSKLYHIAYAIANEKGEPTGETITIATVRPETILGDTAIAIHPEDERYLHLHGRCALVPLIHRKIPIITDPYVTPTFGTGALKVTPAHDMNDFQLGEKHHLEVIDIMNDDGSFSEAAQLFVGEDRFAVRKKILPLLQEKGHLAKVEDYKNQVGYSERSDAVVEPRLSMQWWVRMKPLAEPALKAVMDENIQFHPSKFKNLYRHWMENIKDWCISRQLWWGHRIPAWYLPDGRYFVAATREEAWEAYLQKIANEDSSNNTEVASDLSAAIFTIHDLKQDEDCLDTWFSSWLWPFEVFKGYSHPGNADAAYYYPTATLVTAPEIIFFWVARMIMAGLEYKQQIPFRHVYFTGIVRDEKGRKMSKSLGNSPDLLQLIDNYGADAVRFGIMISSPAGNDLLFDVKEESTLKQGSFFVNKMWNALRLMKMWEEKGWRAEVSKEIPPNPAHGWFRARLENSKQQYRQLMADFNLSEALKLLYTLIWNDFCSSYLEWIKPLPEEKMSETEWHAAREFFEELLLLLHPFMPFVTEEVFHQLLTRKSGVSLCTAVEMPYPQQSFEQQWGRKAEHLLAEGNRMVQVITQTRDLRNKQQLKPKDTIDLYILSQQSAFYEPWLGVLARQLNAIPAFTDGDVAGSTAFAVEADRFFIKSNQVVDSSAQRAELLKDREHQKQFMEGIQKKLANEKFVQNAKPEVVALERKKLADAAMRLQTIEDTLQSLENQ